MTESDSGPCCKWTKVLRGTALLGAELLTMLVEVDPLARAREHDGSLDQEWGARGDLVGRWKRLRSQSHGRGKGCGQKQRSARKQCHCHPPFRRRCPRGRGIIDLLLQCGDMKSSAARALAPQV